MLELLIVDDDVTLLRVLGLHFENEGYAVRTAPSGEVAMAMIKLRLPNVMILDAIMPGMSGIDVCRKVHETSNGRSPVIILTAQPKYESEAREAGASAFITKPFKLAQLSAQVRILSREIPAAKPIRVLLLEDRAADAELEINELAKAGYAPDAEVVDNETDFRHALGREPDLVLADYSLPEFDGLAALKIVKGMGMDVPVVIVSGAIGEEVAVEAVQAGASDYVLKDRLKRLGTAVSKALVGREQGRSRRELEQVMRQAATEARMMMNTVSEGVVTVDEGGRIVTANPPAAEIMGRGPSALFGVPLMGLLDAKQEQTGAEWLKRYIQTRGDSARPSEWHRVQACDENGGSRPIDVRATSMELESGRTTVLVFRAVRVEAAVPS